MQLFSLAFLLIEIKYLNVGTGKDMKIKQIAETLVENADLMEI